MNRKVFLLLFAATLLVWFLSHVNFLMESVPHSFSDQGTAPKGSKTGKINTKPGPRKHNKGNSGDLDGLEEGMDDEEMERARKGKRHNALDKYSKPTEDDDESQEEVVYRKKPKRTRRTEAKDEDEEPTDSIKEKRRKIKKPAVETPDSESENDSSFDDPMETKPFPHPYNVPKTTDGMLYKAVKDGIKVGRTYKNKGDPKLIQKMLNRYREIHNKITSGQLPPRYVVARPNAGLGNRIFGMMGVFVFALVTDRALIVDFAAGGGMIGMHELFEECGMKLNQSPSGSQRVYQHKNGPMDYSPNSFPVDNLLCSDYSETFTEDTIVFSTNNYMGPLVARNPRYKDNLKKVFGDDIYGPLARFIMKPSKRAKDIVDNFKARHFGKYTIGLQLRIDVHNLGGQDAIDEAKVWEKLYFDCATQIEKEDKLPAEDTKFFIAADNVGTRDRAIQKYGKDKVIFIPESFESPTGHLDRHFYGWVDMLLLAECDDVILSSYSSFGLSGIGIKSHVAKMVTEVREPEFIMPNQASDPEREPLYMNVPLFSFKRSQCVRQWNTQPCMHFYGNWRSHKCPCYKEYMMDEMKRHC